MRYRERGRVRDRVKERERDAERHQERTSERQGVGVVMNKRPEIALSKVKCRLEQELIERSVSRFSALKHRGRPLCPNFQ